MISKVKRPVHNRAGFFIKYHRVNLDFSIYGL